MLQSSDVERQSHWRPGWVMVKNWPRTDGPNIDTICTSIRRPMFGGVDAKLENLPLSIDENNPVWKQQIHV